MKTLLLISFLSISIWASAQYTMTYQVIKPTCSVYCDGKIMITNVTGGILPYTLKLNSDSILYSNLGDTVYFMNLCGGSSYNVTIVDASASTSVVQPVTVPSTDPITMVIVSQQNPTCSGSCNGSVQLSAQNGTPPYQYNINGEMNSTGTFSNLCGQTYYPFISDSNGCELYDAILDIIAPSPIQVTENESQPYSCMDSSGFIYVNTSGGTPPYTYLWSTNSTHDTISNLHSGNYTLTVTDSSGCTVVEHYSLNMLNSYLTLSGVSPLCYGQNNGKVFVAGVIPNGTFPCTLHWSTGQNYTWTSSTAPIDTIFNAQAGDYFLTITDNTGSCSLYAYYQLTQPDSLHINPYIQPINCYGVNSGMVQLSVTGGPVGGNYTYLWNDGATSNMEYMIGAGIYKVTVTDLNGCTITGTYVVTQPDSFYAVVTKKDISCFGANDAQLIVKGFGGTQPYYYSFDGQIYNELTDTIVWVDTSGTYTIYVKDKNYCSVDTFTYTVIEPTQLVINSVTLTQPTCLNNDGSINFNANGGTSPYIYLLDGNSSSNTISGLSETSYLIEVDDSHGCYVDSTIQLLKQSQLPVIKGTVLFNQLPIDSSKVLLFKPGQFGAAVMDTVTWSLGSTFDFSDLTPGSYFLKADYLDNVLNAVNTYYNGKFYWMDVDTIPVNCNDTIHINLNLDSLPMVSGPCSMSGKVDFVSNKMGKAVSEPVPGAEITVEQVPGPIVVKMTATDTSGHYHLNNLPDLSGCNLRVDIPGLPLLSTYSNLSVNSSNPNLYNLNFLVDTTSGGGIYKDSSSLVNPVSSEPVWVNVSPNPFSTSTVVEIMASSAKTMNMQVFDALGKSVLLLPESKMEQGVNRISLNKNQFPQAGIYYIVIHLDNTIFIKKVIHN
jgi:hypothetical protein